MQAFSRLPLNALRVLAALGQTGSMVRAAELLNVQPSAVSMQIKNLSDYVGLPMIVKHGKQVKLSAHGEKLLAGLQSSLSQIEASLAAIKQEAVRRPFTLSVLPSFLYHWLLPRLPDFERQHPEFHLRVLSSRELVDLTQGEADAAVRLGGGSWPGLTSIKLMDESLLPVCAPTLIARGAYCAQGELPRGVKLLHSTNDPWSLWSEQGEKLNARKLDVDDATALVAEAEAGLGAALVRLSLVQSALAHGRLVPLGDPIPYRFSYYWVSAKDPRMELSSVERPGRSAHTIYSWLRLASLPAN